ncbi:hypothetical protein EHS86_05850 [Erwinia amylovora]|uniref:Uncharacterized protein n=2 Tax=Erwinia amylovora TaxID=552 RepID=A0A831A5J8_ERWAM|nr:hypothetical protein AD997_17125 [Erwinia amylovora]EKV52198.1 hypothetical protein EaACW_3587 [Erwinia amylovora ACW56400]CBA23900.1 hypothetical protein predicted by Glimmer/Critica [Erwinia amylovora CFBP1430]CCO80424.1 hypothetical protein BN432_3656 [Erwinia amylovora Ea356]CCO84231.1 hypothetical protein BN433_3686 [Erwinia amylovora Ea266]CCO87989.1 hypothetical protein BN434_3631 [Erwinia amylovora CFBP 2585]CCO91780.1 hypothetical protein BN435_3639 [Erwinia amylovora 01SFR-BO]CC
MHNQQAPLIIVPGLRLSNRRPFRIILLASMPGRVIMPNNFRRFLTQSLLTLSAEGGEHLRSLIISRPIKG